MTELSGAAAKHLNYIQRLASERMESLGDVIVGSGSFCDETWSVDLHSCYGPSGQDKEANQDFAVGWMSHDPNGEICWAVAIADGVTASSYSAAGSRLACWSALNALLDDMSTPRDSAWHAVDAAGEAIGTIFEMLTAEGKESIPDGEVDGDWKFRLRRGRLLQTTLMLAWVTRAGAYCVAVIGDGGAQVQRAKDIETMTDVSFETNRVHALGPLNRRVEELDCWAEFPSSTIRRGALFTDGVSKGLHTTSREIFTELDQLGEHSQDANSAADLIADWIRKDAKAFDDNLTLVVARSK